MVHIYIYVCVLSFTIWGTLSQPILPPLWDSSTSTPLFETEATPTGTLLTTIRATGRNGVNVMISMYDDTTKERVYMNYTSGTTAVANVYLKQQMDRDHGISEWNLLFQAYDSKIGRHQVPVQKLTIIITDVNDTPPRFTKELYQVYVKEDAPVGTFIVGVQATDPDNGAGGVVTYSIVNSGHKDGNLSIDERTGSVRITHSFDYEREPIARFRIIAHDVGSPSLTSTAILIVHVRDVQDTPPQFSKPTYNTALDYHSPVGTFVLTTRASAGDLPDQVKYSITNRTSSFHADDCHTQFIIHERSGAVYTVAPFQHIKICSFVVQAFQGDKQSVQLGRTASTTDVVVSLTSIEKPFG